jgi:tRNA A37 methylthiotransferase MiaB
MPRAQIIDASCSRRSLELGQVRRFLQGNGDSLSREDWRVGSQADLIMLCTCGFTAATEDMGFEALRRIQRAKKVEARVLLGGCIPEINPERVTRDYQDPTFSPRSCARLDDLLQASRPLGGLPRPNTLRPSTLLQDVLRRGRWVKAWLGHRTVVTTADDTAGNRTWPA